MLLKRASLNRRETSQTPSSVSVAAAELRDLASRSSCYGNDGGATWGSSNQFVKPLSSLLKQCWVVFGCSSDNLSTVCHSQASHRSSCRCCIEPRDEAHAVQCICALLAKCYGKLIPRIIGIEVIWGYNVCPLGRLTGRPHLSSSRPHPSHVAPPHSACEIFFGVRTRFSKRPQLGQVSCAVLTPHLFFLNVPTVTSTHPTSSAAARKTAIMFMIISLLTDGAASIQ